MREKEETQSSFVNECHDTCHLVMRSDYIKDSMLEKKQKEKTKKRLKT